jgi:hypothetical protein
LHQNGDQARAACRSSFLRARTCSNTSASSTATSWT